MSWQKMNHYELQAMRKLLMLDVKEAAEFIGKVSARTWQYWETGRNAVPDDVDIEIYGLISNRNLIIDNTIDIENDLGAIKYYKIFDDFKKDFKDCGVVSWRLHQSVCAYLFANGGEVELIDNAKINKKSYIYEFFSNTRIEDIEYQKQEKAFNKKIGEKNDY